MSTTRFRELLGVLVAGMLFLFSSNLSALPQEGGNEAGGSGVEQQQGEQQEETEKQDGRADLDSAFEKKITARTERDLAEVVRLCKSAIEKGLEPEAEEQAKQLMVSSLLSSAEGLSQRVLGTQDNRWRAFRSRAVKLLAEANEVDPKNLDAWLLMARLQSLPGGDEEVAREASQKALELAGDSPAKKAQALLVQAVASGDEPEKALEMLNEALAADPSNLEAIRARGQIYLELKQPEKAIEDFFKWLETNPENVGAWFALAAQMERMEHPELALQVLDRAITANDGNSILYLARAQMKLDINEKDFDNAIADLNKATELDENNLDAWRLLATTQLQNEKFEESLSAVNKLLEADELSEDGKWLRSIILASAERYDEALIDLRWLANTNPAQNLYQQQMAAVLNAMDKPREALKIYDKLVQSTRGRDGDVLRGRGDAWLSIGEHQKALEDYEKALKLMPEDSGLLNNLSWLLSTSTFDEVRDGKRSLELALKACELSEYKAAHILSTLAAAYAETDDFEKAREWARKAVELAESEEQKVGLQEELDSYIAEKPWRELESVDEGEEAENAAGEEKEPEAGKKSGDKDGR